jgi:hypothetical protein
MGGVVPSAQRPRPNRPLAPGFARESVLFSSRITLGRLARFLEGTMNPSQRFLRLSGASLLGLLALNVLLAMLGPAAFEALRRSLETVQYWLQAIA